MASPVSCLNTSILRTARFARDVIRSVLRACDVRPAARGDVCEPSACLSTSATCLPLFARWNATLDPRAPDPITTHSVASIMLASLARHPALAHARLEILRPLAQGIGHHEIHCTYQQVELH